MTWFTDSDLMWCLDSIEFSVEGWDYGRVEYTNINGDYFGPIIKCPFEKLLECRIGLVDE